MLELLWFGLGWAPHGSLKTHCHKWLRHGLLSCQVPRTCRIHCVQQHWTMSWLWMCEMTNGYRVCWECLLGKPRLLSRLIVVLHQLQLWWGWGETFLQIALMPIFSMWWASYKAVLYICTMQWNKINRYNKILKVKTSSLCNAHSEK